jgi:membrane-bound lytic murein transglycosylase C
VRSGDGAQAARYVRIPMVSNFESRKAERYRPLVTRHAGEYEISPSLVFAIIRTESNFNPFAVSPAPAYGLMQLVPASGGLAGYRRARGVDEIPTPEYLFDAGNNIELGTAYLNVLRYAEFKAVPNPISRDYCVIAAYNTGPGNVLRTFSTDRAKAYGEINRLEPGALYERLRASLPYVETRRYLATVVDHRRQFVSLRESGQ